MQVKSQDVDVVFGVSRADSRRAFKDAVKGVELPPIGREDVDHARIALKTYISQWCAAGITAEVSELIHDLIRAAEVRGLNRGLQTANIMQTNAQTCAIMDT